MMTGKRFDRSATDILLNGGLQERGSEVRMLPSWEGASKVRSDPALLPLNMVRIGTEEYQLFAPKRDESRSVTPRQAPYPVKERLPRWLPPRLKWPLENALGRFLGERPRQPPWLLQVDVSWPSGHRWNKGAALMVLCPLLAWSSGMSLATVMAGTGTGFLHGIFLRIRTEKCFDWNVCKGGLMASSAALYLALAVSGTPPALRGWTARALLWKPLSGCLGLAEWFLVMWVSLLLPFFKDPKASYYSSDTVTVGMLLLTLLYASNFMVPLGLWAGTLLKVTPPPPPPPPPASAVTGALRLGGTPHVSTGRPHQGPAQSLLPEKAGSFLTTASPTVAAAPAMAAGELQHPQHSHFTLLEAPQEAWHGCEPPPLSGRERLLAKAALLKREQGMPGDPRRWLSPTQEDEQEPGFDDGLSRARPRINAQRGPGAGNEELTWSRHRGSRSSRGGSRSQWGDRIREEQPQSGASRYGLRSRRGRTVGWEDGKGELEPAPMELSASPPPPVPMDTEDNVDGVSRGSMRGLGRFESLNPHQY